MYTWGLNLISILVSFPSLSTELLNLLYSFSFNFGNFLVLFIQYLKIICPILCIHDFDLLWQLFLVFIHTIEVICLFFSKIVCCDLLFFLYVFNPNFCMIKAYLICCDNCIISTFGVTLIVLVGLLYFHPYRITLIQKLHENENVPSAVSWCQQLRLSLASSSFFVHTNGLTVGLLISSRSVNNN